jgi:hypothetical protein
MNRAGGTVGKTTPATIWTTTPAVAMIRALTVVPAAGDRGLLDTERWERLSLVMKRSSRPSAAT